MAHLSRSFLPYGLTHVRSFRAVAGSARVMDFVSNWLVLGINCKDLNLNSGMVKKCSSRKCGMPSVKVRGGSEGSWSFCKELNVGVNWERREEKLLSVITPLYTLYFYLCSMQGAFFVQTRRNAGKTTLSRAGDGRTLFMSAANSAAKHNEVFKAFTDRLRERGLKYKQAIAAVARKLLMVLWAIAKAVLEDKPVFYPGGTYPSRDAKKYCTTT